MIISSTLLAEYRANISLNIQYLVIGINCIIGMVSLIFNILPLVFIFDYVISCGGLGFTMSAAWQINDGYDENASNSTLVVFGLAMILLIPFRIFWWSNFYPNSFSAMQIYTKAMGLQKVDNDNDDHMTIN